MLPYVHYVGASFGDRPLTAVTHNRVGSPKEGMGIGGSALIKGRLSWLCGLFPCTCRRSSPRAVMQGRVAQIEVVVRAMPRRHVDIAWPGW